MCRLSCDVVVRTQKKEATGSYSLSLPKKIAAKSNYAENDVPQPQPPVALGFSKVKPEPIIFDV